MAGSQRPFHGLNGKEVALAIMEDVKNVFARDSRFGLNIVFAKVTWKFNLELDVYPAMTERNRQGQMVEAPVRVEAGGTVLGHTEAGTPVVDLTKLVEPEAMPLSDGRTLPRFSPSETAPVEKLPGLFVESAPRDAVNPFAQLLAKLSEMESEIKSLKRGTSAEPGGMDQARIDAETERLLKRRPEDVGKITTIRDHTTAGEPISAGFKAAPGPEAAASWGGGAHVGVVQSEEAATRIILGEEHAPLIEGGIGSPDNVRRQLGLAIPQPQQGKGPGAGIVDLPAGSF